MRQGPRFRAECHCIPCPVLSRKPGPSSALRMFGPIRASSKGQSPTLRRLHRRAVPRAHPGSPPAIARPQSRLPSPAMFRPDVERPSHPINRPSAASHNLFTTARRRPTFQQNPIGASSLRWSIALLDGHRRKFKPHRPPSLFHHAVFRRPILAQTCLHLGRRRLPRANHRRPDLENVAKCWDRRRR
jgi:hypothetical protein